MNPAIALPQKNYELDRLQHASDRHYAISNLERTASRLHEVQIAHRRIDSATFGICVSCEENIHPQGHAAVPRASVCILCQEASEKTPRSEIRTSLVRAA